jgi:DNA (cytosine-5)-methyltransferase 1
MFDGKNEFKIDKPIRLIELFAGYGSQSLALKYLGVPFEHHKIAEWTIKSTQAYKDLHFENDNTDYSKDLSVEWLIEYLLEKGVSQNYSEPMSKDQIKRLGEEKVRTAYNNIIATHNLVSVCTANGKDLEITDTDKFTYLLTYSFPCQDLSSAGLGKGMEKGSGTRSGLLWEVERLLDECEELPQVLLMENVPEVIGTNNIKHFAKWIEKLESLGYKNKWQCLNAKDFEIPQNRDRCFMVSILGDYYYDFPKTKPLKLKLKDMLEDNVDESFYLSERMVDYFEKHSEECKEKDTK